MYLKLQAGTWMCILYLLYCRSEQTDFQQKDIGTYINNLCYIQGECDVSMDSAVGGGKLIGNTCCKGCPCGNNCSVLKSDEFANFTGCLKPSLDHKDWGKRLFEYKFVIKEPADGCVNDTNLQTYDIYPSCSLDIVTELGSYFYPVYSYDKKVNFGNKNCALCHGAKDLVYWDSYSMYKGKRNRDLETITVNFNNFNSTDVFTWFVAPNKESSDFTNICYDIIDRCNVENGVINIPDSVDMTQDQVKKTCEYGPRFLFMYGYKTWYKNIFCAFCNGIRFNKNDLDYCENSFFSDGYRSSSQSFTFLLKRDYIDTDIGKSTKPVKSRMKMACIGESSSLDQDRCREVLCPILQSRLRDGRCDYPFDTFNIDKIVVTLNLTGPRNVQPDFLISMTSSDIKHLFEKHSPWSRFREILFIQIRNDITERMEFLVCIGFYTDGPINIRLLYEMFRKSLAKSWVLDVSVNDSIFLSQNIFVHGLSIYYRHSDSLIQNIVPQWTLRSKNHSFLMGVEKPSWKRVLDDVNTFHRRTSGDEISIKKSFLCNQVKLEPMEYIFEEDGLPLFLKKEKKVVYPEEYYVYRDGTKGDFIAICLEDSRFKLFKQDNAAGPTRKETIYVFTMLILAYLVLIIF